MPTTCWLQSLWPGYLGLGPIFSTSRSANIFQPSGHADTIWHGVSCWHFYMPIESTELTFVGKDLLFLFSKHAAKAHLCIYIYIMHISGFPAFFPPCSHGLPRRLFLRLLMSIILRSKLEAVYHFGLVCGSWVVASRGSTLRSYLAPMGMSTSAAVQLGNAMVSRLGPYKNSLFRLTMEKMEYTHLYLLAYNVFTVMPMFILLALLIYAIHGTWTLEQPHWSLLFRHRRFQWLLKRLVAPRFSWLQYIPTLPCCKFGLLWTYVCFLPLQLSWVCLKMRCPFGYMSYPKI